MFPLPLLPSFSNLAVSQVPLYKKVVARRKRDEELEEEGALEREKIARRLREEEGNGSETPPEDNNLALTEGAATPKETDNADDLGSDDDGDGDPMEE